MILYSSQIRRDRPCHPKGSQPVVRFLTILITLASVLLLASAAWAEVRTITVTPKPGDNTVYTSVKIETNSAGTRVAIPGFVCIPDDRFPGGAPSIWTCTQGAITRNNPGVITLTNPNGTASGTPRSYDYTDRRGVLRWVAACFDPIGICVLEGGPTGMTFLGYEIPPNEYGYFYQVYLPDDAPAAIETIELWLGNAVGHSTGSYNFQVLSNSFPATPDAGFDLTDLELPPDDAPDGFVYEIVPFMEEDDAAGSPAVSPAWTFDDVSGIALMDFSSAGGLQPGQTSSLVAYTSPYPPVLPPEDNLSATYEGGVDPPCTRNPTALTPRNLYGSIPTLSEWGAIGFACLLLGAVLFYVIRRRRTSAETA